MTTQCSAAERSNSCLNANSTTLLDLIFIVIKCAIQFAEFVGVRETVLAKLRDESKKKKKDRNLEGCL